MRRREKFIIVSVLLSLGLLATQYVPIDWRYGAIALFALISYFMSAWALSDDLQIYEWLTILPLPVLYASSVALFYFLLPEVLLSRLAILAIFGVGMYALFLTANIFSVAKGRTIQLLYAAHAIALFFTMITSLLLTNTIFSLRLPFYFNALLVALAHFILVLMSLWSVQLEPRINRQILSYSFLFILLLAEFTICFSFLPMQIWHISLFIMSLVYVGLSLFQNLLQGRLFKNTATEYALVAIFIILAFIVVFPGK